MTDCDWSVVSEIKLADLYIQFHLSFIHNRTTCACRVRIGLRKLSRTAQVSLYVRLDLFSWWKTTYANPSSVTNLQHKFLQIMKGVDVIDRTQGIGATQPFFARIVKWIGQGIQAPDKCEGRLVNDYTALRSLYAGPLPLPQTHHSALAEIILLANSNWVWENVTVGQSVVQRSWI